MLPAVELHAWDKALLYLFSFCLTSILVMGAFAGLWGEMSYRLGCVRLLCFLRVDACGCAVCACNRSALSLLCLSLPTPTQNKNKQAPLAGTEGGLRLPTVLGLPVADRGRPVARAQELRAAGAGVWVKFGIGFDFMLMYIHGSTREKK